MSMEIILSLLVGLGLSAACGFRIFVPLLVAAIAVRAGYLSPGEGFQWMGTNVALISLGVATILEIGAYYIPCVDNFLDLLGVPAAMVAGAILTASFVTAVDPWLQWSLAAVAGGGTAAVVHAGMATARGLVTTTTAGLGNSVVSTGEAVVATGTSILAIVAPVAAGLLIVGVLFFIVRFAVNRARARRVCGVGGV